MNLDKNVNPELADLTRAFDQETGQFSVQIKGHFESSHYLYAYFEDGSDENMHGHSWTVIVTLERADQGIDENGISVDFIGARKQLDKMLARIDHECINELSEFARINPTAENIAKWFYAGLKKVCADQKIKIISIKVYEGPSNIAIYLPG